MINAADKNNNHSSLEDRHFLSDPRPVPGLDLPTWEVDVHREGVEQPILTLKVDAKVLPPRKKKKKTLWKLPDSIETKPKFGEQDKRRILELFREKKKELKKLKNKQRAYRRASSIEAMNFGGGGRGEVENGGTIADKPNPANGASLAPKNLPPENGRNSKVNNDDRDDSSLSPPGFGKLSITQSESKSTSSLPPVPNPEIHSPSPLKPAPPGLPSKNQQQFNGHQHSNHQNGSSSSNASASQPFKPPGLQQNGQHTSQSFPKSPLAPLLPPGLMNGHLAPKQKTLFPPRAVGRSFVLPPEAPPGASMAKYVTESYYLLLRNGLIRDLDSYYFEPSSESETDLVYKAVTVGGAHAVCATQQDRLVQHHTFAGCEMRIKGVQQQPTVGKGILVLITGVSIRTTAPSPGQNGQSQQQQQQQQQQLPFCHTIILKPVLTTTSASIGADSAASVVTNPAIGYQILNDNLVILTGDE